MCGHVTADAAPATVAEAGEFRTCPECGAAAVRFRQRLAADVRRLFDRVSTSLVAECATCMGASGNSMRTSLATADRLLADLHQRPADEVLPVGVTQPLCLVRDEAACQDCGFHTDLGGDQSTVAASRRLLTTICGNRAMQAADLGFHVQTAARDWLAARTYMTPLSQWAVTEVGRQTLIVGNNLLTGIAAGRILDPGPVEVRVPTALAGLPTAADSTLADAVSARSVAVVAAAVTAGEASGLDLVVLHLVRQAVDKAAALPPAAAPRAAPRVHLSGGRRGFVVLCVLAACTVGLAVWSLLFLLAGVACVVGAMAAYPRRRLEIPPAPAEAADGPLTQLAAPATRKALCDLDFVGMRGLFGEGAWPTPEKAAAQLCALLDRPVGEDVARWWLHEHVTNAPNVAAVALLVRALVGMTVADVRERGFALAAYLLAEAYPPAVAQDARPKAVWSWLSRPEFAAALALVLRRCCDRREVPALPSGVVAGARNDLPWIFRELLGEIPPHTKETAAAIQARLRFLIELLRDGPCELPGHFGTSIAELCDPFHAKRPIARDKDYAGLVDELHQTAGYRAMWPEKGVPPAAAVLPITPAPDVKIIDAFARRMVPVTAAPPKQPRKRERR